MSLIETPPTTDEVLRSVRETKHRLAAAHVFSVARIIADARRKQLQSGHIVLPPPAPKSVVPAR